MSALPAVVRGAGALPLVSRALAVDPYRAPALLVADGVTSFDNAVRNVSLRVRAGEVVALAGDDARSLASFAAVCLGAPLQRGAIRVGAALHARLGLHRANLRGTAYVLDDPFAGLDAAARANLATRLAGLARAGAGVLVLSRDRVALASCADRLIVMREGRFVAEFERAEFSEFSMPGLPRA